MTTIHARTALTDDGWSENVLIETGPDGRISSVSEGPSSSADVSVGILLPSPANLHSHSFQRAMAGLTERRGRDGQDSFWTWRELMYRFLEVLDPDDIEAIAAWTMVEMLEAGYSTIAEFHYIHHQQGGETYDDIAELSQRIMSAANSAGIGLTHLPVLYQYGGADKRPLTPRQMRFSNDPDRFSRLYSAISTGMSDQPADWRLGVAPHSLRAASREGLYLADELVPDGPIHIHIAEQTAEVEEIVETTGQRPVEWLLEHCKVDQRWCLIHATWMTDEETGNLARSGAVAGLCPITEANLGDGIFNGAEYLQHGGLMGVGSDSNVRISLAEELRLLEYSQRFRDRQRAVMTVEGYSTGRFLFDTVLEGGARATARESGKMAVGQLADLVALDDRHIVLEGCRGDNILDAFVFAGDDTLVTDTWSAGRHMVRGGRHIHRDRLEAAFRKTLSRLRADL